MVASYAKPGKEDVTIWNGDWGDWKGMKGPSSGGYYACGAMLRSEDDCGPGGGKNDDTAANGLVLWFCHIQDWRSTLKMTIYNGRWGEWKTGTMCPYGWFIDGAQVMYEDPQGDRDDTALNGLKIHCKDPKSNRSDWFMVFKGPYGTWKPGVVNANNKLVSAAEVRFEKHQGGGKGDDSAMNGIKFQFSDPTNGISLARPAGQWVKIMSGDNIKKQVRVAMTMTDGQSVTEEKSNSVEAAVSVGFDFVGISTSQSIKGIQAKSVSNTMHNSFSLTQESTMSVDCSSLGGGLQVLWQWEMEQPADEFGPGFTCLANDYRCTKALHIHPKCPLGFCKSLECQECVVLDNEL